LGKSIPLTPFLSQRKGEIEGVIIRRLRIYKSGRFGEREMGSLRGEAPVEIKAGGLEGLRPSN